MMMISMIFWRALDIELVIGDGRERDSSIFVLLMIPSLRYAPNESNSLCWMTRNCLQYPLLHTSFTSSELSSGPPGAFVWSPVSREEAQCLT